MSKKEKVEVQPELPGIPQAEPNKMWRITYQYQGPNYALRAGSLVIPQATIDKVRIIANGVLKDQYGDKWFNITKIQQLTTQDEAPF